MTTGTPLLFTRLQGVPGIDTGIPVILGTDNGIINAIIGTIWAVAGIAESRSRQGSGVAKRGIAISVMATVTGKCCARTAHVDRRVDGVAARVPVAALAAATTVNMTNDITTAIQMALGASTPVIDMEQSTIADATTGGVIGPGNGTRVGTGSRCGAMSSMALDATTRDSGGRVAVLKGGVTGVGRSGASVRQVTGMALTAPAGDGGSDTAVVGGDVTVFIGIIGDCVSLRRFVRYYFRC